jgi:hypothetical protein
MKGVRAMTRKCCALVIVLMAAAPALAAEPNWQPVLTKVLESDKPDGLGGVVVNHEVGCVFVNLGERGIYCSAPGAGKFNPLSAQAADGVDRKFVQALKERKDAPHIRVGGKDARHVFALTRAGIAESTDGGATWLEPIALPRQLKGTNGVTWLEYDPKNDILYVMNPGSDLYKLARRK